MELEQQGDWEEAQPLGCSGWGELCPGGGGDGAVGVACKVGLDSGGDIVSEA